MLIPRIGTMQVVLEPIICVNQGLITHSSRRDEHHPLDSEQFLSSHLAISSRELSAALLVLIRTQQSLFKNLAKKITDGAGDDILDQVSHLGLFLS